MKKLEDPLSVKFDFKFSADDDILYLNPIFENAYKENPFKAAVRSYPVEMPNILIESFVFN